MLKACIIGDSKQGGYGHDMHMAFALQDSVRVVGLADPDEEGRKAHAAECKAERMYADYREMLEKERPDIVAIGPRWTINHKDYVLACAEAGAHGFLEKPVASDLEEADAMLKAVADKNLKWSVAFNVRATPIIEHVKHMVTKERIIGTVVDVRMRGKEDGRAGSEDLIVLGVHSFDLLRYLMGGPEWCFANMTMNGKPALPKDVREASEPLGPIVGNRLNAMYGLRLGVAGHFGSAWTREGAGGRWGVDLYGTKGIITIRMGTIPDVYWIDCPTWAPGGTDAEWKRLPDAPEFTMDDQATERHKIIVDDLLAAIKEDRQPAVSLADGVGAQEMIQAVFESHVQGKPVAFPLENRSHPLKRWS